MLSTAPRPRSLVQILSVGIAALLGTIALSGLFAVWQARALGSDVRELTGRVSLAREAAFELEINAEELASATRAFLEGGDPAHALRAAESRGEIARFRRQLHDTGLTGPHAPALDSLLAALVMEGDSLVALQRRRPALLQALRTGLAALDSVLDEHVQRAAEAQLPARAEVFQAGEEMEINLVELAGGLWEYLAGRDPAALAELRNDREDFERFLGRYRALARTPAERGWGRALDSMYAGHVRLADSIVELEQRKMRGQVRFSAAEVWLERVLDGRVQPYVEAERARRARRAQVAAQGARVWLVGSLLLAVVIGTAVAGATLRAVGRPVRALSAAAARIAAGDFRQPVGRQRTAEFEPVAAAFDRMAAELAAAQGEQERARVAAQDASRRKSEFVSEASHELRTPLTAIRASLALLPAAAGGPLAPRAAELLAMARRNTERLMALIDGMLDLDRVEAGAEELRRAPLEPAALVGAAAETVQSRADERGVSLACAVEAGPVLVGDAARLERVLINLLSNAVKYAPAGSTVRVRARPAPPGWRFEVEDGGAGIPEAVQGRIFQRFARATGAGDPGGTGLGLALARAIVEQHGGEIGFESRPGHTRFWFTVPGA